MAWTPKVLQKTLRGQPLDVVGWDLECTSLSGMIGRVLCCSFKPLEKAPYTLRGDKKPYKTSDIVDDRALVVAIRDELEKYDLIVSHNGKLFDSKFLAARLFKAGERPRENRYHVDTMWAVRSNLRISSKLENIQLFTPGIEEKKTPITWDNWARASAFNSSAMDVVVEHCEQDVKVLEEAYLRLIPYLKELKLG